ncbi:MAG: PHP domain-containing protein [Proteobacteria bacterium]|nr:PHP domain-containing protein [Pseudomonadota bacterium]
MIVDFHCHSNCSDGSLSPSKLIELAEQSHVEILSITDHDNVDAYSRIGKINTPIKIIAGIEFSTVWNKIGVHIIGLNIDIDSAHLQASIEHQKRARKERALIISKRLEKVGLFDGYNKITSSTSAAQVGRPDFAKLLITEGIAKDWSQAFKKYLGAGKAGDVKSHWLTFDQVISCILESGGVPVLAHPLYYQLTNSKLKRLLGDFIEQGGVGLEVLNGYQNADKTQYLRQLCHDFDLKVSVGSDFHNPASRRKLGINTKLFADMDSVWDLF